MSEPNGGNDLAEAAAKAFDGPFNAVIEFLPDDASPIWVDGRKAPKVLDKEPENTPATCIWRGSKDALLRVLAGERALENAFVSGRITIAGDMSVMARLKLKGSR